MVSWCSVAGVSEVRQRLTPSLWVTQAWHRAALGGWLQRVATGAVWFLAFAGGLLSNLALTVALLTGALSGRFASGPLDITPLVNIVAMPPGIALGTVTLRWTNPDHQAVTVAVTDADGPGGHVQFAEIAFALSSLTQGRVEPIDAVVEGLRLTLVRSADGSIKPTGSQDSAGGPPQLQQDLRSLRHVRVTDAMVAIEDAGFGTVTIAGAVEATREGAGVTGAAGLHLVQGSSTADLTATAMVTEQETQIDLVAAPTELAAILAGVPHLAGTAGQLGLRASIKLTPGLTPSAASVQATMGPGRLVLYGVPVPFRALDIDGTSAWTADDWRPVRAELRRMTVTVAAASGATTTAVLTAQAGRQGEQVDVQGTLQQDHTALADLSQFWPAAWGGHARPWIVENIVGGTARDGRARFAGTVQADGTHPQITALNVTLQGDDVAIAWLRPVPAVQHANATLTMTGPDVIEVRIPTARQGPVPLQNGLVRITGLSVKDQDLSVVADIANGTVPDLLTLLKHPRLNLLSAHPIPIERPAGTVRGRLEVTLPLESDLQLEQVGIHASGQLAGLRLGGLVAGRDIDRGTIGFDVTQDGMRADGDATVASIPSTVAITMDFRAGPPGHVTQTATMNGRATPRQLAAAGLDAGTVLTGGSLGIMAELTEREKQGTTIQIAADIGQAQMRLLGWRKEPGAPARATTTILVKDGKLAGIPALHVEGPGLLFDGRAEVVGDAPSRLVLQRAIVGPTNAAGVIDFPQGPAGVLRAQLHGTMLDLSSELADSKGGSQKAQPFVVDLRFDTIRLAAGSTLADVSAHAEYDGTRLRALQLQTQGPERVQALIVPAGTGRKITVRIADGGAVLRGLGVTNNLVGGAVALDGQFDDRTLASPLDATLDITEFHVRDAPAIGKLLQAFSVYGVPEAISGPGLKFSRLIAPFVWNGKSIYLGESQAFSASLGLTAKGVIDIGGSTLDLAGTVVPLYVLNAALGRVPLVGRLFSPEQGGGLFAVSFGVHGPTANPSVAVNPLSVLTPGLARRLFRLFN